MNISLFENELRKENDAENSIIAYKHAVIEFFARFKVPSKENLLLYKTWLIESYKPKTVNLRIQGIDKYLDYIGPTPT